MKRPGSNTPKKQERTQAALQLLGRGMPSYRIVQALMAREPEISPRTAQGALSEAKQIIRALGTQSSLEERGQLKNQLDYLYQQVSLQESPDLKELAMLMNHKLRLYEFGLKYGGGNQDERPEAPSLSPELANLLRSLEKDGEVG